MASMTGGMVVAKYPADKHIKTAAMTLLVAVSRRLSNEYGNSASRIVMS